MAGFEIRWATPDDLQAVMSMSRAIHSESPWYSQFPFDDAYAERQYFRRINGGDRFSFIAFYDGVPAGFLLGYFSWHLTAPLVNATEELLYVLPEYRGKRVGVRLLREMERWAKAHGAKFLKIGNSTGITPERTARLYQHVGFTLYSNMFIKELP